MRLSLYYPTNPFRVNQHFGNNQPCVRNFGKPNQQVIDSFPDGTCPIGSDKLYPHFGMDGHNGTDLSAGEQEIRAACAGTVIEKQTAPARGLGVGILTNEQVDIDGIGITYMKIRYWHLKSILVEVGDQVSEGDLIGISDNTGYSSGNHLHFEGQPYHKDEGGHPILTYGNGTFSGVKVIAGAIDIEPYFNGQYASDIVVKIGLMKKLIIVLQKLLNYLRSSQRTDGNSAVGGNLP